MKTFLHVAIILISFNGSILSQEIKDATTEMQPRVTVIFPTSDTLPENLLRMYVHFSKPMEPFGNLEKIQLKDEYGQTITGAIFNNVYELWDREQKQLTLIFDPSRVKTGLTSNEERGRALENGKRYNLVIGELRDVEGQRTTTFIKPIVVSEEDLNSPNIDLWDIKIAKAGSRTPLVVRFPERLDRLSLLQRLKLTDSEHQALAGSVKITKNECEWHFYPDESWRPGDYILHVHSRLEDPSGNNINGLFDHQPGTLKNKREDVIETIKLKVTK